MDDLVSNFDLYLKAFGLTLALFVVSGVASLLFGAAPRLAAGRPGRGPAPARRRSTSPFVRNTPLLMIFIFMASRCRGWASPSSRSRT